MWLSIFYYAAVIIILFYLAVTITKFREIPPSISETYYMWKEIGKEWVFTCVMWVTGLSILIYWVSIATNYRCQFLSFFSVAGMCFVGGACMFKETLTKETHYFSAFIWAIGATLFFIVNGLYMPILIGFLTGLAGFLLNRRNLTFWAEIACVVMMVTGIFLL